MAEGDSNKMLLLLLDHPNVKDVQLIPVNTFLELNPDVLVMVDDPVMGKVVDRAETFQTKAAEADYASVKWKFATPYEGKAHGFQEWEVTFVIKDIVKEKQS